MDFDDIFEAFATVVLLLSCIMAIMILIGATLYLALYLKMLFTEAKIQVPWWMIKHIQIR